MNELKALLEGLDCPINITTKKPCKEPEETIITITGSTVDMTDFWKRFHAGEEISLNLETISYDDKGNVEAKIV